MEELTYTIYEIVGSASTQFRMLVHMAEEPDDAYTFSAAIVKRDENRVVVERQFDEWVTSMWQSPNGLLCAVSFAGNIHTLARGAWATTSLGQGVHLNKVWGLDDDRIYTCGMDSVLVRKTGGSWERIKETFNDNLTRVVGTADDDLYVLGGSGPVYHFDGTRWSTMDSPTNSDFLYMLFTSRGAAYICGRSGALFHVAGNVWEELKGGGDATLYSLARFNDRIFVGAGPDGLLEIQGKEAVPLRKDIAAYGVRVIGDRLFVFGNTRVEQYDGRSWSGENFNFQSVIAS